MVVSIIGDNIFKMKEFYILIYIILVNIYGISLMAIDKKKAEKNRWRIRERNIFLISLLGGSAGVMMGMTMFRHKTQHSTFTMGIPAIFVLNILIGCALFYWIYIA